MVFVAFVTFMYIAILWLESLLFPAVSGSGPRCPTCRAPFTPEGATRWSPRTDCLDGVDYCADCKRRGLCGCG